MSAATERPLRDAETATRILEGEADIPAATRIVYGPNRARDTLAKEVGNVGSRAFLVTGRSLGASALVADLREALGPRFAGHFDGMGEHSPRSTVIAAARAAKEAGADVLVGIGGGSSIVGTKGVALVMGEGENLDGLRAVYDYRTRKIDAPPLLKPKPAVIAIPTTLSAGEFSSAMGITSDETGSKDIFIDPKVVPRTIILDPVMTTATPPRLWASTGIKGLHNAIERYYARNSNPFMEGLCLEATRNVFRYLKHSIDHPDDLGARGHLQFLNWMTAFGAGKGGIGLGHGICHQLGGVCDVPHGITGCIVLPHMMAFNRPVTAERQQQLAAAMGIRTETMSAEAAAEEAAARVRALIGELGLPQRLRDVGVTREALPKVAELTLHDRTLSPTPRPPRDAAEILALLEEMY